MVQRKAPTQSDHVKTEKQFGKFKPSLQRQDSRNKGPDMMKKKKKTLSVSVSEIGCLSSPSLKKPTVMMTPVKQSAFKSTDGSPNYMKGTSSSEARRESLVFQVRSQKTLSEPGSKMLRRRVQGEPEPGSDFGSKPKKNLFRSLTKTWSFKKRCRISCSADPSVQKATCSSTLKDSKVSEYLILNPGGTEAEGTSVLKVCPYTYCSLNGHLHKPYIPLKSFISGRRRVMKALRNSKKDACNPSKPDHDETLSLDVSGDSEKSQVCMSFSDGAPRSEIDSEENFKFLPKDSCLFEAFSNEENFEANSGEADAVSFECNIRSETDGLIRDLGIYETEERSEDSETDDATNGEEIDQDTETLEGFVDDKFPGKSGDVDALGDTKEQDEAQMSLSLSFEDSEEQKTEEEETKLCSKGSFSHAIESLDQEQQDACGRIWMIGSKKTYDESEDWRAFNPREPNYLPIVPDPDAETVNLKHQDINEKNTEELMIDYALQQAVSRLSSARNKKVASLVAAFETVVPKPNSGVHVRQIQACN